MRSLICEWRGFAAFAYDLKHAFTHQNLSHAQTSFSTAPFVDSYPVAPFVRAVIDGKVSVDEFAFHQGRGGGKMRTVLPSKAPSRALMPSQILLPRRNNQITTFHVGNYLVLMTSILRQKLTIKKKWAIMFWGILISQWTCWNRSVLTTPGWSTLAVTGLFSAFKRLSNS